MPVAMNCEARHMLAHGLAARNSRADSTQQLAAVGARQVAGPIYASCFIVYVYTDLFRARMWQ